MENIITLKKVNKKFKNNLVVNNVTFDIKKNDIVGIVGRNGSGKTVLLKLICGLYIVDNGTIIVNDNEITKNNCIADNIGALIDTGFLADETGLKNLKLLANLKSKVPDEKLYNVMKFVGLDPWNKTKYKNYSTGMKQKLKFAQAIMEDHDILILDEPFNGMDKESVENLRKQVLKLQKEGKTIIITSHYHEDVNLLCNRIFEMDCGILTERKKKYGQKQKS